MKVEQARFEKCPSDEELKPLAAIGPHLVLVFGSVALLDDRVLRQRLSAAFAKAALAGCTTAGEISRQGVSDNSLIVTAIAFDAPGLAMACEDIEDMADSRRAGARLAGALLTAMGGHQPHNVIILGQGVAINGSALIEGMRSALPRHTLISGGLAGDAGAFKRTLTLSRKAVSHRQLIAIGFHAPRTALRHGCFHGWKPFGPLRKVTRCAGNILHELDGQPALDVYARYLGEHARDLPASGLLFPFEMLGRDQNAMGLIRTILDVDRSSGTLTLAGDIIDQGYLRLMHATTDSLVEGAEAAAQAALPEPTNRSGDGLSLLFSCVGRKLVMGSRVDEEIDAIAAVFGARSWVAGFYSNGEISPSMDGQHCDLHNQTMAIAHLYETAE